MYKAIDIARYIINNYSISNLQLQKILYFIQAYYLVYYDKKIFNEDICKSPFCVVVWEVYNEFKMYGALNIPHIKQWYEGEIWNFRKITYENKIAKEDCCNIDKVVNVFSKYHNHELNDLVWNQIYDDCEDIIEIDRLKEYFKGGGLIFSPKQRRNG